MALKHVERTPQSTYGAAFCVPLIKVVCSNLGSVAAVPLNLAGGKRWKLNFDKYLDTAKSYFEKMNNLSAKCLFT